MKKPILFLAFAAVCFGQAQPGIRLAQCDDAGANDTYTCTAAPTVTSYTGLKVLLTINTANTGAATLNIDAVGAKTIHKISGGITTTLADNDLVPKGTYILIYNATDDDFKVISSTGGAAPVKKTYGASFYNNGSALAAVTTSIPFSIPTNCTVSAWTISVDAGTATFKVWKISTGTAIPTGANVINTSGIAISTGTHVRSTTLTDFTDTDWTAADVVRISMTAVATATMANVGVECVE